MIHQIQRIYNQEQHFNFSDGTFLTATLIVDSSDFPELVIKKTNNKFFLNLQNRGLSIHFDDGNDYIIFNKNTGEKLILY